MKYIYKRQSDHLRYMVMLLKNWDYISNGDMYVTINAVNFHVRMNKEMLQHHIKMVKYNTGLIKEKPPKMEYNPLKYLNRKYRGY